MYIFNLSTFMFSCMNILEERGNFHILFLSLSDTSFYDVRICTMWSNLLSMIIQTGILYKSDRSYLLFWGEISRV